MSLKACRPHFIFLPRLLPRSRGETGSSPASPRTGSPSAASEGWEVRWSDWRRTKRLILSLRQEPPAAEALAGAALGSALPCGAAILVRSVRRSGQTSVASQHNASPKRVAPKIPPPAPRRNVGRGGIGQPQLGDTPLQPVRARGQASCGASGPQQGFSTCREQPRTREPSPASCGAHTHVCWRLPGSVGTVRRSVSQKRVSRLRGVYAACTLPAIGPIARFVVSCSSGLRCLCKARQPRHPRAAPARIAPPHQGDAGATRRQPTPLNKRPAQGQHRNAAQNESSRVQTASRGAAAARARGRRFNH